MMVSRLHRAGQGAGTVQTGIEGNEEKGVKLEGWGVWKGGPGREETPIILEESEHESKKYGEAGGEGGGGKGEGGWVCGGAGKARGGGGEKRCSKANASERAAPRQCQ